MHMRIIQGGDLIVDLPDWDGPIPRTGDYIFHPPLGSRSPEGIAGSVKTVTWRTHDRGDGEFVQTARPYVEISI
jgi:hypothetical protein